MDDESGESMEPMEEVPLIQIKVPSQEFKVKTTKRIINKTKMCSKL